MLVKFLWPRDVKGTWWFGCMKIIYEKKAVSYSEFSSRKLQNCSTDYAIWNANLYSLLHFINGRDSGLVSASASIAPMGNFFGVSVMNRKQVIKWFLECLHLLLFTFFHCTKSIFMRKKSNFKWFDLVGLN